MEILALSKIYPFPYPKVCSEILAQDFQLTVHYRKNLFSQKDTASNSG
jgi:hypothetical protein